MKNRLVIFDCFGVIFEEIAVKFFNSHFSPEQAALLKDKFFVPADLGQITYDEIFENMEKELNWKKEDILSEWNKLFIVKTQTIPYIRRVKEKADVVLLSNAPLGLVEKLFEENNLTQLFDRMIISANVGLAKPDPEIYRLCVSSMEKEYDEIYMIDDSPKNLEPLPQLGITPILFRSTEDLELLC